MKKTILSALVLCLVALLTISCASTQSRYSMLVADSYSAKPEGYDIQTFYDDDTPQRPFLKISRLDVHLEKTHFIGSSLNDALPDLKKQARLSGADAIIDIKESSSMVGETKIYHVTATGIRYTQ